MTIPRSLLAKAFPDNPRLRAQLEAAFELVDSLSAEAADLKVQLDAIAAGTDEFQPLSDVLTKIAGLAGEAGAVELVNGGEIQVRPIDGSDEASLMSRGIGHAFFLTLGGRGASGSRPTPSANTALIYFDTTLAAAGKPIFNYANTGWVDATGASV